MTNDNEDILDDDELHEQDGDQLEVRLKITVDKGQESIRIDKYVQSKIEHATRNKIQQAIEEGIVLVNGEPTKANYKIRPLDEIIVFETRSQESTEVVPEELELDIRYEDARCNDHS